MPIFIKKPNLEQRQSETPFEKDNLIFNQLFCQKNGSNIYHFKIHQQRN